MRKIEGLKPTQVLVGANDVECSRRLQIRLLSLGVGKPGPTMYYRAGLRALEKASDEELISLVATSDKSAILADALREMDALKARIEELQRE